MKWSVVCCSKNEGPDILEWASWYKLMGAENIYLYDAATDNTRAILDKYIREGFVVYIPWTIYPAQYPAYSHAINLYRRNALLLVDADELLVPMTEAPISETLDQLFTERVSGIGIGWDIFGNNGHTQRPQGMMIENYTKRVDYEVMHEVFTKCIIMPDRVSGLVSDPHWFSSRPGYMITREDGTELKWGEHHHRAPVKFPKNLLKLNHYFTKSYDDFCRKVDRRGPDGNTRLMQDFHACNNSPGANDFTDTYILKWAPQLRELIKCYK